ncbi:MAG: LexA family transcriptional regulator [Planctomycetes bacterium]|nr:LexA family transcriptional regulator [Planctomycetota bacterium]MBU1518945.1 LexA family transcriptional regulator [Planctomycetota bacterium]
MIDHSEKSVIERIVSLRKGFSGERGRKKFAALLGISPSTYSYYEKDRVPPIPILLKICELCNVNIGWLLTGKSDEKSGKNDQISLKIRKIIEKQPASLQAILAFLDLLEQEAAFQSSRGQSQALQQDSTGWIPVLGRTAAGVPGLWGEAIGTDSTVLETHLEELVQRHINASIVNSIATDISIDSQARPIIQALNNVQANLVQTAGGDDQIVQFVDCPQIRELLPDCFALQIDGDSMAPRINDGDIVIVSPSIPASPALPAVVRIANAIGVTCKLMRIENETVHLVPINEKYDTKIVKRKDLLWTLAVLCHIRLKNVDSIR